MGPGAVSASHLCPRCFTLLFTAGSRPALQHQPRLLNFVPDLEKCLLCVLKEGTSTASDTHGAAWPGHCSQQGPEGQGCPAQCQPLPGRSTSLSQGPHAGPAFMRAGTPGHGGKPPPMDLGTWALSPDVGQCLHLSEPQVGGSTHTHRTRLFFCCEDRQGV